MSEVFDKKTWVDRQSQYPTRRRLTNVSTSEEMVVDVEREEGTVDVAGHPFNAAGMNDLEDRIEDSFATIQENFQAGVDAVYDACVDKGSTPESHALADVVEAIENISSGGGINMFGTPTSDMPEGGTIATESSSVITDHEAYKAFGDNVDGWVSDRLGAVVSRDTLEYSFTDGKAFIPLKLQFCSKFNPQDNIQVYCAIAQVLGSNDGETWDELVSGIYYSADNDQLVTIDIDTNVYYSKFRFVCVSERYAFVGLKHIKCWGVAKESGGGIDTVRTLNIADFLFVE